MKADWFLLNRLALFCFLLAIARPLLAQQSGSDVGQRIPLGPHRAKQATALPDQPIERRCRELLEPLDIKETGDPLAFPNAETYVAANGNKLGSEQKARFYIAEKSDVELLALEMRLRECVTDLPSRRLRRDALEAHQLVREQQVGRVSDGAFYERKKEQERHEVELKKQHDDFLVAAKFAAAVYKENEQRKEEELNLLAAFNEESRHYRDLYDAVQQVLNVAGQLLSGSSRSSLPAFVEEPVPQLIRVQTPAVPKALHCSANTTPNLSTSPLVSTSTTWINCWQY